MIRPAYWIFLALVYLGMATGIAAAEPVNPIAALVCVVLAILCCRYAARPQ